MDTKETLEEAALNCYNESLEFHHAHYSDIINVKNQVFKNAIINTFIGAIKWQSQQGERKYSESDMIQFAKWIDGGLFRRNYVDQWVNEQQKIIKSTEELLKEFLNYKTK